MQSQSARSTGNHDDEPELKQTVAAAKAAQHDQLDRQLAAAAQVALEATAARDRRRSDPATPGELTSWRESSE